MPLPPRRARILGGTFALLLVLHPLAASAQRQDSAQAYIRAARRYFENLEYERALQALDRAQRRARTKDDTVAILLHEGIILAEMGKSQEATAAFKSALRLKPDAQLPLVVSPKIENQFQPLRQEAMKHAAHATAKAAPEPKPATPPPSIAPSENVSATQSEPAQANVSAPQSTPTPRSAPLQEGVSITENASHGRALGPRVLVPAITGGVLLIAGGISWNMARSEYSKLEHDDPSLNTRDDVDHSASRGKTLQTVGFGLLGAGLVGLGIATGLYVTQEPETSVSLAVGTDGRSAFIQGRWP
ncbi:tetratricopeptide repeat protein [Hyalangium versicolor]|uniref:tetratricopeptide repeat protein n=1 Tax=Hyalangium versicolor TaxID=2861190 RepID=UPI001CC8EF36|nr:tetratricopeptide repeat protein [Hyalangium versicolor]